MIAHIVDYIYATLGTHMGVTLGGSQMWKKFPTESNVYMLGFDPGTLVIRTISLPHC